eukprot:CAMPEP_0167801638 /NCGR_PEP_ID=MMETSP0111_2-20121227/18572_1 /TAXON_ID=91324 /ORGANISM="Lotharella globosa, Strain CCCM811" /LENGTH=227 /DNA_ID=CAMNT_0007697379 /DNA_START=53 /DNA_END=736 /DNA_ORIENTATION=-
MAPSLRWICAAASLAGLVLIGTSPSHNLRGPSSTGVRASHSRLAARCAGAGGLATMAMGAPASARRQALAQVVRAGKGFGEEKETKKKSKTMSSDEIDQAMAEMRARKQQSAPSIVESSTQRTAAAEQVSNRILGRMVTFAGIPTFSGILLLPLFYFLRVSKGIEIPLSAVYASQGVFVGAGLLGITYGALSASWDPSRPGSALGVDEFKTNLPIIWQRIRQGEQRQ